MSYWTHIVAAIDVDTYKQSRTIKEDVEKMLTDAPKITGSEGPADVFVNVLSGYNHWTSCDCQSCEYGNTRRRDEIDGGWYCDAADDYNCPSGEYQSRVVITVVGDLRDRMKDDTKSEWKEFKKYIEKHIDENGFGIRNCSYNIKGY